MTERVFRRYESDDELEYLESEEEFEEYLDAIAPYIGWVVIYFNSLEEHLADFIREAVLRDPIQDERLDVFLSEMQFAAKCRALIHLYGQMIESCAVKYTQQDLTELEKMLLECAKRRNEYAHADWIDLRKDSYVRVKSQSKKLGVFHRYRKFEIPLMEVDVEFINNARHVLCEFHDKITAQVMDRETL
jgi:hypothetical protein